MFKDSTFMLCRLCREDANDITGKLRKITVADIIKSMDLSVVPYTVYKNEVCSIHKLKINLYKPEHYPKHTDITEKDWEETMTVVFLRKLEDAIEIHMKMLHRIRGICNDKGPEAGNETDNDDSVSGKQNKDDGDDDGEGTEVDDLGSDAQKQKKQVTDEMDYEENSEDETNETSSISGVEDPEMDSENEDAEVSKEDTPEPQEEADVSKEETMEPQKEVKAVKNVKEQSKKKRRKFVGATSDRHIFVRGEGEKFEVHFQFATDDPHILLAQVPF